MIRRTSILLFELLAGLLTGLVILMGVGAWFLSSGPISLTFLTPLVERALGSTDDSYTIRVEDTVLTWAGWKRAVDIRANNVTIEGEDGSIEVTLPEVSIGFSLRALSRGSVMPTSLDIIAPKVSVIRSREGKVVFGLIDDSRGDEAGFNRIIERLIAQLLGPADLDRPLSRLRSVAVLGADLTFDDKMLDVSWRAPLANVVLQRNTVGLGVDVDLHFEVSGQRSRITGELSYDRLGKSVSLAIRFKDINPALIADGAPRLALLSAVNLPVSGSFGVQMEANGQLNSLAFSLDSSRGRLAGEVTLTNNGIGLIGTTRFQNLEIAAFSDLVSQLVPLKPLALIEAPLDGRAEFEATTDGRIGRMIFDISTGAGELKLPSFYSKPVTIVGMKLRGSMIDDLARIHVDDASIDLGGPTVMLQASASRHHDDFHVQLEVGLREFQAHKVKEYWPEGVASKTQNWISDNIIGGIVSEAHISLTARLNGGATENIDIQSISGSMNVQGTSVNYHSPLPMFTDVDGKASFNNDQFDINISNARLRDVRVGRASIKFGGLTAGDVKVAINMWIRGSIATVAEILDHAPISLSDDFAVDPQKVKGELDARINFDFPLSKDLTFDKIVVSADGSIFDATVNETPYGLALTNGDLTFNANNQGLEVIGRVRLNGVQADLNWQTNFDSKSEIHNRFGLTGRVNDRERSMVGMIPVPFLTGPVDVDIDFTEFYDGRTILVLDGDITHATVDISPIDWRKPPREKGKFEMFMVTEPNGSVEIQSFTLKAGDMDVLASIIPKTDFSDVYHIEFDKLRFSGNDISAVVDALSDGGYRISLEGRRLDVAPFLKRRRLPDVPYAVDRQGVPLVIQANIDEVTDGPDRRLSNVAANGRYDGQDWQALIIDAEVGDGARLELSYQPSESGYSLRILSDNAGQALNSLNWTDRAQDGALVVTGTRASLVEPMIGNFKVTDYRLIEAPALARLLQVASLTGILSALSQHGGLEFVTLDGDFSYQQGKLDISNTRTYGSSIGITVEGFFDLEKDTVNIKGTIIPAYTINRVLGVIPVLGRLLTGGKDEGVFAATYKVKGSIENPTITANPLLALAPGILRSLLGLLGQENSNSDNVLPVIPEEVNEGK